MKPHISLLILLTASLSLLSQESFELGIQLRPRAEMRSGYSSLVPANSKPAAFISQRSRVNLKFSTKKLSTFISLQDVRTWGSELQGQNVASIGLHEAWAELGIKNSSSFRLGRQEWIYDDDRLLGNVDWTQNARSHDALLYKFEKNKIQFHLGAAYSQAKEQILGTNYGLASYKVLSFGRIQYQFNDDKAKLSLMAICDAFESDTSLHKPSLYARFTAGPVFKYSSTSINGQAHVYYQMGQDAFGKKIGAYFFSLSANKSIGKNFSAGLGVDYASGKSADATDAGNHSFNTLYATNHKYYGHMDYFLNLPKDSKNAGLMDIYLKTSGKIKTKHGIGLDAHYFLFGNKVKNPANTAEYLSPGLGLEMDLFGSIKPMDYAEIKLGYSHLFGTGSLEYLAKIPGGIHNNYTGWGWAQIMINPTIFKSK